ncbi:hypothetical protein GCM10022246_34330 [Pedobacter ginsengiterrae]|uniref:Uncharacterized protein n=1 Tax=Pedobacter ginsengiterrae TaxID=871696 RepID=A0ABP7QBT2_9SPHI
MSIYFQYPTINEYPDLANPLKTEKIEVNNKDNEGSINLLQLEELKDFLALKPV